MKAGAIVFCIVFGILLLSACSPQPAPVIQDATASPNIAFTPTPSAVLPSASPTTAPTMAPTVQNSPTTAPTTTAAQPADYPTASLTEAPQSGGSVNTPAPAATAQPTQVSQAATSTPAAPADSASSCVDRGGFFGDVTFPDDSVLKPGDTFVKTWKLRNEGTCTWNTKYSLVYIDGDRLGGALTTPLTGTVAPGEITDVSIKLTAPNEAGRYVGNWMLSNPSGQRFGVGVNGQDIFWLRINIGEPPAADQPKDKGSQPAPGGSQPAPGGSQPAPGGNQPAPGGNQPAPGSSQPAPGIPTTGSCTIQANPDFTAALLAGINAQRIAAQLPALTLQDQLSAAAIEHSTDMACNDYVGHIGSDGSNWKTRVEHHGYKDAYASENIYYAPPAYGGTPDGAVDWWMHSKVHKDNILSKRITQIGIGYVYNPNSAYLGYFTIVFARP